MSLTDKISESQKAQGCRNSCNKKELTKAKGPHNRTCFACNQPHSVL